MEDRSYRHLATDLLLLSGAMREKRWVVCVAWHAAQIGADTVWVSCTCVIVLVLCGVGGSDLTFVCAVIVIDAVVSAVIVIVVIAGFAVATVVLVSSL